jgi:cysteine synthase A
MASIFANNSLTIGQTPLVELQRIAAGCAAKLMAKIEGRNPAFSVKCRIGTAMIDQAEREGKLTKGQTLLEPTSGNTGIALAFVAAARGIPLTLTMPESMSMERRKLLTAFGAHLVLTDGSLGMRGAIEAAQRMVFSEPDRYVLLQQFSNPANPQIHHDTTGPEIWKDTDGAIDVLVCGVGTGGTITGVSRYIKQTLGKPLIAVAVEPSRSAVISQTRNGDLVRPGTHRIQGIGAGFIPENLDLSLLDRVETVSDEAAIEMARRLIREEGILAGISCGAATTAAVRLAQEEEFAGKNIVVVLPDSGERYLSTSLFTGVFDSEGLPAMPSSQ